MSDDRGPGVRIPPPLIFLTTIVLGILLQYRWPNAVLDAHQFPLRVAGFVLITVAFLLLVFSLSLFRRAKTAIEPWKPASKMITTGLFRFSRNPIYLAFIFIQMGIALVAVNSWMLLTVFPALLFVYWVAIKPEERYLEGVFGEEYVAYKRRVRRWL